MGSSPRALSLERGRSLSAREYFVQNANDDTTRTAVLRDNPGAPLTPVITTLFSLCHHLKVVYNEICEILLRFHKDSFFREIRHLGVFQAVLRCEQSIMVVEEVH